MQSEDEKVGGIRKSFIILNVLWFVLSLFSIDCIKNLRDDFSGKTTFPVLNSFAPLFLITSVLSVIVIIYAEFMGKQKRNASFPEMMKDRKHRYHLTILLLLLILAPSSVLYKFIYDYYVILMDTLILLFSCVFLPVIVFTLSLRSSGLSFMNAMKKHKVTGVFLFILIVITISNVNMIYPIMQPDVEFYRDSSTPDFNRISNNTAMAELGVVNYGILPARDIYVEENGSEIYHIGVLKGGETTEFKVNIHCDYNCSYEDEEYFAMYGSWCCETNLTLVYEGHVVDRMDVIYAERNTCTDTLFIVLAPLVLFLRKPKHR